MSKFEYQMVLPLIILASITIAATTTIEKDIPCHYLQQERMVVVQETPNTDGMTKRVTYEIYIDRIASVVISNDVIHMTNEIDSGNAKFRTEPVDPRLSLTQ